MASFDRDNLRNLRLNKPGLFKPVVARGLKDPFGNSVDFSTLSNNEISDTNIDSTGSFKYHYPGLGIKSTQQLYIDWGKFENHTFFNSAQVKVNTAFERITNEFPFDGTKKETEQFFEKLGGFEKYVFDTFPKRIGYLFFSGTNGETSGGTFVRAKDIAGSFFTSLSKKKDGSTVVNPGLKPLTVEMHLFVPSQSNDNQVILQKAFVSSSNKNHGFQLMLNSTSSVNITDLNFSILSGSTSNQGEFISTTIPKFKKGKFNHVAFVWDRTPGSQQLFGYLNQKLEASASNPAVLGPIKAEQADILVGSGSQITSTTPDNTLSGAIDELRIFHSIRTDSQRKENEKKALFASDDLKLYYKFNEPSASKSSIVLDHSSNSVHGKLSANGLKIGVREFPTSSVGGQTPMKFEKKHLSPVLFPHHPDVIDLRTNLLLSASKHDDSNPNLITKLVPDEILEKGKDKDGLQNKQGKIVDDIKSGVDPRSVNLGDTQALLLLLYTWAQFFDEVKLFTQAFSTLNKIEYNSNDTIPDQFLQFLARKQGIELPPLFQGSSIDQFIDRENIQNDVSTNKDSLDYIQNQIWRRILINLQDIIKSKGTLHSVKSFIRATGIDPEQNFRIREFGGPTKQNLDFVRETRKEQFLFLSFNDNSGSIESPFLKENSRDEPGFPNTAGTDADTLLTSGSFTYEGTYRFNPTLEHKASQSLARVLSTGSKGELLLYNLVWKKDADTLELFGRPNDKENAPMLNVTMSNVNLLDGDQWYISFGRQRNDEISSRVSSSYFLRAAKQNFGEILEQHTKSLFYNDNFGKTSSRNTNILQSLSSSYNASGSFIQLGSSSLDSISNTLVDDSVDSPVPSFAQYSNIDGQVNHIRFWSKSLSNKEWKEHVRNPRSVGVIDPKTNFNFVQTATGSFEKLRLDVSMDQPVTKSDSNGEILLTDFSQNGFGMTGSLFGPDTSVMNPQFTTFGLVSSDFDEAATDNKVRIRSFKDFQEVRETPWANVAPVYEGIEQSNDSTKFSIEFSVVDALNKDIMSIFSTLNAIDNAIGEPALLFSPDYPDLEDLREIYFNKLEDKVNLKNFFEFFKWFDTNIGTFVAQLLPRKTRFDSMNFVVEEHAIERSKFEYQFEDIYLGEDKRRPEKGNIQLQLLEGEFSKY